MKMKYSHDTLLRLALLAAVCATATCCTRGQHDSQKASESEHTQESLKRDSVPTVTVTEGGMNEELTLNGSITCDESKVSKVYVPCSGQVQGAIVEVGDHVTRGQVLATVLSQEAASYDKELRDLASETRLAQREVDMKQDLLQSGMASAKEVEEAQARLERAQAEQTRLESVARVNGFARQSQAVLRAPLAGYVFAKNIYNGSFVDDTSNDTPAYEIADLSTVWVIADVYESDIRSVSAGAKVRVSVLAYPDDHLSGTIDKVFRNLDSESKTMKVRVKLDNAEGRLMPGMFANVHVLLSGQGRHMMQVPATSIVFENGNNYVVLAGRDGKWRRQEVSVAHQDGQHAFLTAGVALGDRVAGKDALLMYNSLR